jgi:hypothetical protein
LAPTRGLVSPQQLKGAFIGIGKTQEAQRQLKTTRFARSEHRF